ncbi:MAG TPA: sugar transferase [Candidatus Humimicrobiaceae bacterium]
MDRDFISSNYRKRELFYGITLILSDIVFLGLSFYLSFLLKFRVESFEVLGVNFKYYVIYSIVGILLIVLIFGLRRLYNFRNLYKGMGENEGVVSSIIVSIFIIIMFNYYFNRDGYQLSRIWLLYSILIPIALVILSRTVIKRLFFLFLSRIGIKTNVVIIGINEESKRIAHTFNKSTIERIKVIGFVDDKYGRGKAGRSESYRDVKVLGTLSDLGPIIEKHKIDRIIISSPNLKYFDIMTLLDKIGNFNIEVQMSPSLFEFSVSRMKMFDYMGVPLIQIQKVEIKTFDKILKSIIDYSIGFILLIIFVLLYSILGILIKIDSKGPVLYAQQRYGKDFKIIRVYKFRTMRTGADKEEEYIKKLYDRKCDFKIKDDPRITRIGRFLRKTSIDELPQVINVFKGELSVIGPRALAIEEGDRLEEWEKKRMQVSQGITGLWQVSGRSDINYEERIKLDLYYIQNWSIWLELKIVVLTIMRIFRGSGAY